MASNYGTVGGNQLPAAVDSLDGGIGSVTSNGRRILLELLSQAIRSELGAVWTALAPSTWEDSPVGSLIPFDLNGWGWDLTAKMTFPALSCHSRVIGTTELDAISRAQESEYTIRYILGEVTDPTVFARMEGMLSGVSNVLQSVIRLGSHPDYASGANVIYGHFRTVTMISSREGNYSSKTGIHVPTVELKLKATECVGTGPDYLSSLENFEGADGIIDLGEPTDDIDEFAELVADV